MKKLLFFISLLSAPCFGSGITVSGGTGTGSISITGASGGGGSYVPPTPQITSSAYTTLSTCPYISAIHDVIPYTALIASSTIDTVTGVTLPANFKVIGITITELSQLVCLGGCTNISSATVSIGPAGNYTAYFPPFNLFVSTGNFQDIGGYFSSSTAPVTMSYQFINTTASSPANWGNGSAASLTSGSIGIDIAGITAP